MMKNNLIKLILIFASIAFLASCEDFVNDYEQPNDTIGDDQFASSTDAQFLIRGVESQFALAMDQATSFSGGMSDELGFSRDMQGASFPTFEELNLAIIESNGPIPVNTDNTSVTNLYNQTHEFRKHADLLLEKLETQITFNEGEEAIENDVRFKANMYAGVGRYLLGAYFALEPTQPGSPVDVGPMMTDDQLFDEALNYFNTAETYASDAQTRILNTLRARIAMMRGNTGAAATAAANGMMDTDAPVNALYNSLNGNGWYFDCGIGRAQWHVDERFRTYTTDDPAESARFTYFTLPSSSDSTKTYIIQTKFGEEESPIRFVGWQENSLILAELAILGGDNPGGLALINQVRNSYGLSDRDDTYVEDNLDGDYLALLKMERDIEFFGEGMRLLDQRRWGDWHLDESITWQYMPVPRSERNNNPNVD